MIICISVLFAIHKTTYYNLRMLTKSYIVIFIFAENKKSAIFDRSVGCLRYNRLICLFMMLHEGGIDVYDGLLLRIIDSCNDIILTGNNIFCDVEYSANQAR